MPVTTEETDFTRAKRYYPDLTEFMEALQEEETVDARSADGALHYPKLSKVAGKVYKLLKEGKFPNLAANKTRAAREITQSFIRLRKLLDTTQVDDVFKSFAKATSDESKVYIIRNDAEYFGFDLFLRNYSNHLASKVVQKQEDRTASDAIRVAAVMLAPENRKAVAGILSGVRDRAKSDQAVDPTKAWAMLAVEQFKDLDFVVPRPYEMDPQDVDGIDPNDVSRITLDRTWQWFLETWRHYLKKKYKPAIRRWDKETGGGCHDAHEFSKFCDGNRWLVWVYMLDMENDFLLYSNAHGKPPSFVGTEGGFEEAIVSEMTVDDDGDDGDAGTSVSHASMSRTPAKGTAAKEAASSLMKRGRAATGFLEDLQKDLEERRKQRHEELNDLRRQRQDWVDMKVAKQGNPPDIYDAIIAAHRKKEELEKATSCMTPQSRRMVLRGITETIKKLGKDFKDVVTASSNGSADSDDDDE